MRFQWMHNWQLAVRHDRPWRWLGVAALVTNLGSWLMVSRLGSSSQTLTPLHYTIYFGPDLSFSPRRLLLLPAIGFVIVLVNMWWSNWLPDQLWRRTWMIITLVLSTILLAITGALFYIARTSL